MIKVTCLGSPIEYLGPRLEQNESVDIANAFEAEDNRLSNLSDQLIRIVWNAEKEKQCNEAGLDQQVVFGSPYDPVARAQMHKYTKEQQDKASKIFEGTSHFLYVYAYRRLFSHVYEQINGQLGVGVVLGDSAIRGIIEKRHETYVRRNGQTYNGSRYQIGIGQALRHAVGGYIEYFEKQEQPLVALSALTEDTSYGHLEREKVLAREFGVDPESVGSFPQILFLVESDK